MAILLVDLAWPGQRDELKQFVDEGLFFNHAARDTFGDGVAYGVELGHFLGGPTVHSFFS